MYGKILVMILIVTLMPVALNGFSAEKDDWHNTFYQYRVHVAVEVKQAGWNRVPVTESQLISAVNLLEEMEYHDTWFAYNHVKVVEVDSDGNIIDPEPVAGFHLIPEGDELISPDIVGKQDTVTIPTERGAYYLLSYTSEGAGVSPAFRYDPAFPLGGVRDKYHVSYEPTILPMKRSNRERLFLTDGTPMTLQTKRGWITGPIDITKNMRRLTELKNISLKKVNIEFLADIKHPGKKYWMIYYQPLNGHHLSVPELRHNQMPDLTAKIHRIGRAVKHLGATRYMLSENDNFTAWFAETTVRLTPNTPAPSQSSPIIKVTSAGNEKQSFQIVLNPKKMFDLKSVTASALQNEKQSISSENISFYAIDYVPITKHSYITPTKYLGRIGDPLAAVEPKRLSPMDGNYALWITIRTPAGTPAGTYSGNLTIKWGDASTTGIPVELHVYGFELPEYSPFMASFGGSHITQAAPGKKTQADYHHLSSKEDVKKLARKYYDLMAEHKFTPHSAAQYTEIGMKWSPPPEGFNVDKPDNFFRLYDWDFGELNRDLKHYIDDLKVNAFTLGHINPSVVQRFKHLPGKYVKQYNRQASHISLAWQAFREMTYVGINKTEKDEYIEITQDQYDRLVMDFYRTIAENLNKHGWLDYAYILVDESHYRGFAEFLHFLRLLKSDPLTARIKIAWCIEDPLTYNYKEKPDNKDFAFNSLIDIYLPQAQENCHWWEKYYFTDYDVEPTREKLWTYVSSTGRVTIDSPGINNRIAALEVFNNGGGGFLVWASFMWDSMGCETDNPWEQPWTRWGNGAMAYFYPPRKNGPAPVPDWTIVPSLRMMTYRESVDDYEYAHILEKLIKAGEVKGIDVSEGRKVLNDIERFFYNSVLWSQNDAWYLDLRNRMAKAIVTLKQK